MVSTPDICCWSDTIRDNCATINKKSYWTHAVSWDLISRLCINNLFIFHMTTPFHIGITTANILYRSRFRYGTVWTLQWERHLVRTGYRRCIPWERPILVSQVVVSRWGKEFCLFWNPVRFWARLSMSEYPS